MEINGRRNDFIKVIMRIRRSGKSYLLNNLSYDYLIDNGVDDKHIIKFSFDSAEDLDKISEDLKGFKKGKKLIIRNFLIISILTLFSIKLILNSITN